jgi:hypothetical protein
MNSQIKQAILAITLIAAGSISTPAHTISDKEKKFLAGLGAATSALAGATCFTSGSVLSAGTWVDYTFGKSDQVRKHFYTACGLYMLGTGCFYGTFKCLEYLNKQNKPAAE